MALSCLCAPELFDAFNKPALIMGHPGHELKVLGWISAYKPRVYVLTDGSGRGLPRLHSTQELLTPLGMKTDAVFGLVSDASLYEAILTQKIPWFLAVVDRITQSLLRNCIDLVIADSMEGFNPAHDICRALADAAITAAKRKAGKQISNYAFCLTEWEHGRQEQHDSSCAHFALDDRALDNKLRAAHQYTELRNEIHQALATRGQEYFRIECLKKVSEPFSAWAYSGKPQYEVCGEQRVAEGTYQSVIRYEEHMMPIIRAIQSHATASERINPVTS